MQTSTVTIKGQITIPSALRRRLGLRQGDEVAFVVEDSRVLLVPVKKNVEAAFGLVKAKRGVSLAAMEKAMRERAKR
jgi:AbrB family looped-hinge helix DNA binding protein